GGYGRLGGGAEAQQGPRRALVSAAAAGAVRRTLGEQARRKRREKHGGGRRRVDLGAALGVADPAGDLLALDEALSRLAAVDPLAAQLVALRYFAGLTIPAAADVLRISVRTAERNWTYAKSWLHRELTDAEPAPSHAHDG